MKTHTANGAIGAPGDVYQRVTDKILELLERGTVPWLKPWDSRAGTPANFTSGKAYQGINILLLGMEGRPSRWWMTYRQALERGGQVRKGERGTHIVKYGAAKPKDEGSEAEESIKTVKTRLFLKEFTVFNACQIDGIEFPPELPDRARSSDQRIEQVERIVRDMPTPPVIREGTTIRAHYNPVNDHVEMPDFGRFESPEAFYSTLFHELVHATGHTCRLARASLLACKDFADHAYSKEELVAEMGVALLATETGIVSDGYEASASYLQSWLKVLKVNEHRRWIIDAAGQAAKAVNFITRRNEEPSGFITS